MYRFSTYLLLFLGTVLFQIFLFDNVSVSIYLNPLVYVAFIVLLPLEIPHVALLVAGLAMGATMDSTMGAAGINTIATLFIAFVRPAILNVLYRRDDLREGGVPSPERLGHRVFLNYVIVLVVLHHIVFFSLEALSWDHVLRTVVRVIASSAVSVAGVWLTARIFTVKIIARL